jgi:hypothetical protein
MRTVRKRMDTALTAMLDADLGDDPLLKARYLALKDELATLEVQHARLTEDIAYYWGDYVTLTASLEQIQVFGKDWDFLDNGGKHSRLQTIVKEIRATQDAVEIDLFVD